MILEPLITFVGMTLQARAVGDSDNAAAGRN
jgi:hypothetical protein